jgi:hypothetical protein
VHTWGLLAIKRVFCWWSVGASSKWLANREKCPTDSFLCAADKTATERARTEVLPCALPSITTPPRAKLLRP